jgi:hypothetical protein
MKIMRVLEESNRGRWNRLRDRDLPGMLLSFSLEPDLSHTSTSITEYDSANLYSQTILKKL